MTATHVDGIEVVSDEPTPSPLNGPIRTVYFTRIRTLVLADASKVYGCTECDYTDPMVGKVRTHLSSSHTAKPKTPDPMSHLIADAARAVARLEQQRDSWKARALAAERSLRAIRKVIAP
ncbi:hypothetical protein SAMN05421505_12054 [Sinosporangium album]|uniref:C2H2-type domain-containing protein n=1 Tax=Sinosporangium album TaxID=504805 RepID=A0A1G8EDS9_9ACTN|nr:hypothetical protein [Sinosporangium album]SDH68011.1 hypothetical protein SAMN05421505_12054 [Sinosporangium album]